MATLPLSQKINTLTLENTSDGNDINEWITFTNHQHERLHSSVERLQKKHPEITFPQPIQSALKEAQKTFKIIKEQYAHFTEDRRKKIKDRYNNASYTFNTYWVEVQKQHNTTTEEDTHIAQDTVSVPTELAELDTPQNIEHLTTFLQEIREELFPEGQTEKFVKWASGQNELSSTQKLFIAPAKGIESTLIRIASLFSSSTYTELKETIEHVYGMNYEDWCNLARNIKENTLYLPKVLENTPKTEVLSTIISIIFSFAFLAGGTTKLLQLAEKVPSGKRVKPSLKLIAKSPSAMHNVALAGIALPYLTKNPPTFLPYLQ